MTLLVWRKKTLFLHDFYVMRPLFWAFHHCTGSQQSASRGRVLAFYRIAPCLRPRHTMRQIAATSCHVCTAAATSRLRLVCRCDMSHEFKPVWICATDRSDEILSQRQWFSHVTFTSVMRFVNEPLARILRVIARNDFNKLIDWLNFWVT